MCHLCVVPLNKMMAHSVTHTHVVIFTAIFMLKTAKICYHVKKQLKTIFIIS